MLIPCPSFLWHLYDIVIRSGRFRYMYCVQQKDLYKFSLPERIVCIETDGQTGGHGYIESDCRPDKE